MGVAAVGAGAATYAESLPLIGKLLTHDYSTIEKAIEAIGGALTGLLFLAVIRFAFHFGDKRSTSTAAALDSNDGVAPWTRDSRGVAIQGMAEQSKFVAKDMTDY
jgi:cbb3-type cytochrome oxidase subunit 3